MSLPSYMEVVTLRPPVIESVLELVIGYLELRSLPNASLVSKSWNRIILPELWKDPIKLMATASRPYDKTYRFFKAAKSYSWLVRDLVLILDMRPLLTLRVTPTIIQDFNQYENIITCQWFFRHVNLFRNLRVTVLDGLQMWEEGYYPIKDTDMPEENTRLLLLNATNVPLLESNKVVPQSYVRDVMYLDLSYTYHSEDLPRSLSTCDFRNLRVLKLSGLRLSKLPPFILRLGLRLWSLDLSDNLLTDPVIDQLLEHCFGPPIIKPEHKSILASARDEILFDDPPPYQRFRMENHTISNTLYRSDDMTSVINHLLAQNLTTRGSQIFQETDPFIQATGLTHLSLGNNKFTSSGVKCLLSDTNRIQSLDIGSVRAAPSTKMQIPHMTIYAQPDTAITLLPSTGSQLQELRIHHSIVTFIPTIIQDSASSTSLNPKISHLAKAESIGRHQATLYQTFNPLQNFRLTKLTLTYLPLYSYGLLVTRLTSFLRLCAKQEALLTGARHVMGDKRRAPTLLNGLRVLRLEFTAGGTGEGEGMGAANTSVSGDKDADAFLKESEGDFSFFDEGKRESLGKLQNNWTGGGGKLSRQTTGGSGKMSRQVTGGSVMSAQSEKLEEEERVPMLDVIEQLRLFRRSEVLRWGGKLEIVVPRGNK